MQKIAKGIFVTRSDNSKYQLRQSNGVWWLGVLQKDGKYAEEDQYNTYREGVREVERRQSADKGLTLHQPKTTDTAGSYEPASNKKNRNRVPCSFCSTLGQPDPRHDLCPGTIKNATLDRRDRVWVCPCYLEFPDAHEHATDHRRSA